jgi:hypothetical protein
MRRMILCMIATGSLSAFSTSALPALPSGQRGGTANPVRQARATEVQPQARTTPPVTAEQGKPGQQSGRPQPRGSLIDLSV